MSTNKQSPMVRFKSFETHSAFARDAAGDIKTQVTKVGEPTEPAAPDTETFDVLWTSGTQTRLTVRKELDFYSAVNRAIDERASWVNVTDSMCVAVNQIAMIIRSEH